MNIKDIAKLAGVSPSTVSKVINGKAQSISKSTQDKIKALVRDYHYVAYNKNAVSSASKWVVGIVFNNRLTMDTLLFGMVHALQKHGCCALVRLSDNSHSQEEKNIETLIQADVSAIIWQPIEPLQPALANRLAQTRIPCVTIGLSTPNPSFLNFCLPYQRMSAFLTNTLIEQGHTHIACLAQKGSRTQAVIAGYTTAMRLCGLSEKNTLVCFDTPNDLATLEYAIVQGDFTGLVCTHYNIAYKIIGRLEKLHVHVPSMVSVVSIKNEYVHPIDYKQINTVSACTVPHNEFAAMVVNELFAERNCFQEASNTRYNETRTCHYQHNYAFILTSMTTVMPPCTQPKKRVLVIGSINYDTQISVDSLPGSETTQTARSVTHAPGGKATNQAIGVAKLGCEATIIGAVGNDAQANTIFKELHQWNIETDAITRIHNAETGQAYISVDKLGNCSITLISGANSSVNAAYISAQEKLFEQADVCLIQTEIPFDAIEKSCELAHKHHIPVVLKPVDCTSLPAHILARVDYLIPNEQELAAICPQEQTMQKRAEALCAHGAHTIITTRGERGCYVYSAINGQIQSQIIPGLHVEVLDGTGACDAFISAFTHATLEGFTCIEAARIANIAAAYSTTRPGVSGAFIDRRLMDNITSK